MLELEILTANVLLPTGVMVAVLLAIRWSAARREFQPTGSAIQAAAERPTQADRWAWTAVATAGVGAIWLAYGLRVAAVYAAWPEDAWARMPLAIGIVGLGAVLALWIPWATFAWAVRALFLFLAAEAIIPTGEVWWFLQPSLNQWIGVLVLSPLAAWWLIDRRSHRDAGVLGLSWILCIAAAAFLSKDFLRITEPMLAIASVLGCASLATLLAGRTGFVSVVSGPCLFGCGATVASAQFNSFAGLPDSLSWLAMAAPALAAIFSLPFSSGRRRDEKLAIRRVAAVIVICLVLAAIVVIWTLNAGDLGGSDDWS